MRREIFRPRLEECLAEEDPHIVDDLVGAGRFPDVRAARRHWLGDDRRWWRHRVCASPGRYRQGLADQPAAGQLLQQARCHARRPRGHALDLVRRLLPGPEESVCPVSDRPRDLFRGLYRVRHARGAATRLSSKPDWRDCRPLHCAAFRLGSGRSHPDPGDDLAAAGRGPQLGIRSRGHFRYDGPAGVRCHLPVPLRLFRRGQAVRPGPRGLVHCESRGRRRPGGSVEHD